MKKLFIIGCALSAALLASAGVDNVVVTFSTPGPDTYRDGRTILDGEYYALVWTPVGATFSGIDANGDAVAPSKIVLKAPVAKDGKCPNIMFEIDEGYAKVNFPGGTWSVIMLDTRKFVTDKNGVVQKDEKGFAKVASWGVASKFVNGYGEVGAALGGSMISANAGAAVVTDKASKVPEAGKGLKIRDMRIIGGNVYLYIKGSLSSMQYGVRSGKAPNDLADDGERRYGKTGEDMIIVRPKHENGEFLKVEVAE